MNNLFKPPKFNDEAKTHQASTLHFTLWISIILPVPYAALMIFFAKTNALEILTQVLVAEILEFTILFILHKGQVRLAAWLQAIAFWGFFSILAATTSGVRGTAYLVGSGTVIVLAGAILGSQGATAITLLVCLTGGFLVYAETYNLLTLPAVRTPLVTWIISIMLFPLIAAVQSLASINLRKMVERARLSEARNRIIVNALPDIVFRISRDGVFLDYHAPEEEKLLLPPAQFVGKHVSSVLPAFLAELTINTLEKTFESNQPQLYEYTLPSGDGSSYYETRMFPAGAGEVLAIVRDITEQHHAEEQINKLNTELEQLVQERAMQLKESEQRFRILFESSPEGIFLLDLENPDLICPIVDCNEAACQMNGYTREELIGQSINIVHHAPELSQEPEGFRPEAQRVFDALHRKKDGTIFPIETSSSIIKINGHEYLLGIDRDITERKKAEAALAQRAAQLEESEQRFRFLFDNSPDGIFLIDLEDTNISWPIVDCNEVACRMNGYTREELIGKSIDIIHLAPELPENRARWTALYRTYQYDAVQTLVEWPHRKKDGTIFLIETANRIVTINGHEYLLGMDRDISERKQFEADLARRTVELEESEERFRILFENSPEGIFLMDPYAPDILWPIIDCNEVACTMNGYTREELIGQPIDIIHTYTETRENREKFFEDFRERDQHVIEVMHRKKDGSQLLIETTLSILEMNGKEYVIGIDRDITERKRVEAQLAESEKRFRTLIEDSPEEIFLIDPHDPDILWRIIDCNEAACQWNGYSREELIGKSIDILHLAPIPRENREKFFEEFRQGSLHLIELVHRRKDGSLFTIETALNIIEMNGKEYVLAFDRDITERKRVEAELAQRTAQVKESEQRFRILFENSPEGIFLIDPYDADILWPIIDCNEVACTMNGYTRDELLGQPIDIVHQAPGVREIRTKFFEEFRRDGPQVIEVVHRKKDGAFFSIETSIRVVEINGKEYVLGIDRDITERKRVEATLAQQKNDLEIANKELEAFSYSVSHDLRAPLRSITGFGRILQEDFSQNLDPVGVNYINRMVESAKHLNDLIDGMLKISRLSRAQLTPVSLDLSRMGREVIAALREQDPNRQVDVQIQEVITATADPILMRNVLENLLGNAWKYSSKKERAEISFGVITHEGNPTYFVRDNGAGFDMAYANKLFGSFQRLHRNDEFPGNGIGLASVQRIIQKHNGNIWAEAEVDKGATFYFTLG